MAQKKKKSTAGYDSLASRVKSEAASKSSTHSSGGTGSTKATSTSVASTTKPKKGESGYTSIKNTVGYDKDRFSSRDTRITQKDYGAAGGGRRWYSGDTPTSRETVARMYAVAGDDKQRLSELQQQYEAEISNKGSVIYNPYTKATNTKAIEGLTALGYDVSDVDSFLANNKWLMNYARETTTGYGAHAPTKSSSDLQDAAYWYSELYEAQERTTAAQTEMSQLASDIGYLVERGYSDDAIIAMTKKDFSSNYGTLAKMDDNRLAGEASILNKAVNYNGDDTLYGMIWAARNDDTSGDYFADSVKYTMGIGNKYVYDANSEAARDPSNYEQYNPYSQGSNLTDWNKRTGSTKIDDATLEAWREQMLSVGASDEDQKLWQSAYEANENTKAAQSELSALDTFVQEQYSKGKSADEICAMVTALIDPEDGNVDSDYTTLGKMESKRKMGSYLSMGDTVDFTLPTYLQKIRSMEGTVKQAEVDPSTVASDYENYNPYTSYTVDGWTDAAGGEAMTREYLDAHREWLDDEDLAKVWRAADTALDNGDKANAELEELDSWLANKVKRGWNAEKIVEALDEELEDYTTLSNMEDARERGEAYAVAGADFTKPAYIKKIYEATGETMPETAETTQQAVEDEEQTDQPTAQTAATEEQTEPSEETSKSVDWFFKNAKKSKTLEEYMTDNFGVYIASFTDEEQQQWAQVRNAVQIAKVTGDGKEAAKEQAAAFAEQMAEVAQGDRVTHELTLDPQKKAEIDAAAEAKANAYKETAAYASVYATGEELREGMAPGEATQQAAKAGDAATVQQGSQSPTANSEESAAYMAMCQAGEWDTQAYQWAKQVSTNWDAVENEMASNIAAIRKGDLAPEDAGLAGSWWKRFGSMFNTIDEKWTATNSVMGAQHNEYDPRDNYGATLGGFIKDTVAAYDDGEGDLDQDEFYELMIDASRYVEQVEGVAGDDLNAETAESIVDGSRYREAVEASGDQVLANIPTIADGIAKLAQRRDNSIADTQREQTEITQAQNKIHRSQTDSYFAGEFSDMQTTSYDELVAGNYSYMAAQTDDTYNAIGDEMADSLKVDNLIEKGAISDIDLSGAESNLELENDLYKQQTAQTAYANSISSIADNTLNLDMARAQYCGMTLDEYYKAYPSEAKTAQSIIDSAIAEYNEAWNVDLKNGMVELSDMLRIQESRQQALSGEAGTGKMSDLEITHEQAKVNDDKKAAETAGQTLAEYYNANPARKAEVAELVGKSEEELDTFLVENADSIKYTDRYGTYAAGDDSYHHGKLFGITKASDIDPLDTLVSDYNKSISTTDAIVAGGDIAMYGYEGGKLKAAYNFMQPEINSEDTQESLRRAYGGDTVKYKNELLQAIEKYYPDGDEKEATIAAINKTENIWSVGMTIAGTRLKGKIETNEANQQAISDMVAEYGSQGDQIAFKISQSVASSSMLMAETALTSAAISPLTGGSALGEIIASISAALGEGQDLTYSLREQGVSRGTATAAGILYQGISGITEACMEFAYKGGAKAMYAWQEFTQKGLAKSLLEDPKGFVKTSVEVLKTLGVNALGETTQEWTQDAAQKVIERTVTGQPLIQSSDADDALETAWMTTINSLVLGALWGGVGSSEPAYINELSDMVDYAKAQLNPAFDGDVVNYVIEQNATQAAIQAANKQIVELEQGEHQEVVKAREAANAAYKTLKEANKTLSKAKVDETVQASNVSAAQNVINNAETVTADMTKNLTNANKALAAATQKRTEAEAAVQTASDNYDQLKATADAAWDTVQSKFADILNTQKKTATQLVTDRFFAEATPEQREAFEQYLDKCAELKKAKSGLAAAKKVMERFSQIAGGDQNSRKARQAVTTYGRMLDQVDKLTSEVTQLNDQVNSLYEGSLAEYDMDSLVVDQGEKAAWRKAWEEAAMAEETENESANETEEQTEETTEEQTEEKTEETEEPTEFSLEEAEAEAAPASETSEETKEKSKAEKAAEETAAEAKADPLNARKQREADVAAKEAAAEKAEAALEASWDAITQGLMSKNRHNRDTAVQMYSQLSNAAVQARQIADAAKKQANTTTAAQTELRESIDALSKFSNKALAYEGHPDHEAAVQAYERVQQALMANDIADARNNLSEIADILNSDDPDSAKKYAEAEKALNKLIEAQDAWTGETSTRRKKAVSAALMKGGLTEVEQALANRESRTDVETTLKDLVKNDPDGLKTIKGIAGIKDTIVDLVVKNNEGATGTAGLTRAYAESTTTLSRDQQKQLDILDMLGKDIGVEIVVHPTVGTVEGAYNGAYISGNTVHVGLDALGQGYVQTGFHEVTHWIAKNNGKAFEGLAAVVRQALETNGANWNEMVQSRIEQYAKSGVLIGSEVAEEEIVAESCGLVLTNKQNMKTFATEHKSAFKAVMQRFLQFWQKLSKIAQKIANANQRTEMQTLLGKGSDLQKIYENFMRVAKETGIITGGLKSETTTETATDTTTETTTEQTEAATEAAPVAEQTEQTEAAPVAETQTEETNAQPTRLTEGQNKIKELQAKAAEARERAATRQTEATQQTETAPAEETATEAMPTAEETTEAEVAPVAEAEQAEAAPVAETEAQTEESAAAPATVNEAEETKPAIEHLDKTATVTEIRKVAREVIKNYADGTDFGSKTADELKEMLGVFNDLWKHRNSSKDGYFDAVTRNLSEKARSYVRGFKWSLSNKEEDNVRMSNDRLVQFGDENIVRFKSKETLVKFGMWLFDVNGSRTGDLFWFNMTDKQRSVYDKAWGDFNEKRAAAEAAQTATVEETQQEVAPAAVETQTDEVEAALTELNESIAEDQTEAAKENGLNWIDRTATKDEVLKAARSWARKGSEVWKDSSRFFKKLFENGMTSAVLDRRWVEKVKDYIQTTGDTEITIGHENKLMKGVRTIRATNEAAAARLGMWMYNMVDFNALRNAKEIEQAPAERTPEQQAMEKALEGVDEQAAKDYGFMDDANEEPDINQVLMDDAAVDVEGMESGISETERRYVENDLFNRRVAEQREYFANKEKQKADAEAAVKAAQAAKQEKAKNTVSPFELLLNSKWTYGNGPELAQWTSAIKKDIANQLVRLTKPSLFDELTMADEIKAVGWTTEEFTDKAKRLARQLESGKTGLVSRDDARILSVLLEEAYAQPAGFSGVVESEAYADFKKRAAPMLQKQQAKIDAQMAAQNNPGTYDINELASSPAEAQAIADNVHETPSSEMKYSLNRDAELMVDSVAVNNQTHNVSDEDMKSSQTLRKRVAGFILKKDDSGKLVNFDRLGLPFQVDAEPEGETIYKNASYGVSVENSTMCPRSLALAALMDQIGTELGRPLTVAEQVYISQQVVNDEAFTADGAQCAYCYVMMDRMAYREMLSKYIDQRDAVLNDFAQNPAKYDFSTDMTEEQRAKLKPYQDYLNGRKDTDNQWKRFNMWINAAKNGSQLLQKEDLSDIGKLVDLEATKYESIQNGAQVLGTRDETIIDAENYLAQLKDALGYAQSASWAKKRVKYKAYNGSILKMSDKVIDELNKAYGMRFYSYSDASPAFILENLQMVNDAAVKGAKGLGYTKVTWWARLFAPSGMNINVSVFGKLSADGTVVPDEMMGANWKDTQQLRSQYKNVGAVFVATNDQLVEWALNQDWIDVVIPYHLVRTGDVVASLWNYKNYKKNQEDTKIEGKWDEKKGNVKSITAAMHKNNKDLYFQLCADNNLTPRFEKWKNHKHYMKLVNETRQSVDIKDHMQPITDSTILIDERGDEVSAYDYIIRQLEQMATEGGYTKYIGKQAQALRGEAAQTAQRDYAHEMVNLISDEGDRSRYETWLQDRSVSVAEQERMKYYKRNPDATPDMNLAGRTALTDLKAYAMAQGKSNKEITALVKEFFKNNKDVEPATGAEVRAKFGGKSQAKALEEFYTKHPDAVAEAETEKRAKEKVLAANTPSYSMNTGLLEQRNQQDLDTAVSYIADQLINNGPRAVEIAKALSKLKGGMNVINTAREQAKAQSGDGGRSIDYMKTGNVDKASYRGQSRDAKNRMEHIDQTTGEVIQDIPDGDVKNPAQIMRDLTASINVGYNPGGQMTAYGATRVGKGTAGFYLDKAKSITTSTYAANALATSLHEFGHAVQYRLNALMESKGGENLTATQEMVDTLPKWLSRHYTPEQLQREAVAELVCDYMYSRDLAVKNAGEDFVQNFEKMLRSDPDLLSAMNKARDQVTIWANASTEEKVKSMVSQTSTTQKRKHGLKRVLNDLNRAVFDSTAPASLVSKDLRQAAQWSSFSAKRANTILTDRLIDPEGNTIGDSLATRWANLGVDESMREDIEAYALARHALDRDAQGKPVFNEEEIGQYSLEKYVRRVEQQHPEIAKAADALTEFWNDFFDAWFVDTGMIDKKTVRDMRQMYPHYVPTYRVQDRNMSTGSNVSSTFTLRAAKGSSLEVISPIASMTNMVQQVVKTISQNEVMRQFHNEMQQGGYGWLATQEMEDMVLTRVDTSKAQKQLRELYRDADALDVSVDLEGPINDLYDTIISMQEQWRGTGQNFGRNIVSGVDERGTRFFYKINDDYQGLYELLSGTGDAQLTGKFWNTVRKLKNGFTQLTTAKNPFFLPKNIVRDMQASVNTGTWATTYADGMVKWAQSFYDVITNSDDFKEYINMGGGEYTRFSNDTQTKVKELMNALFKTNKKVTPKQVAKTALNVMTLSQLNEIAEATSRYAEYKHGKHDRSTFEGRREAFMAAQNVTTNFGAHGASTAAKIANTVIPFCNATLQGLSKDINIVAGAFDKDGNVRKQSWNAIGKTVLNVGLTAALQAALVGAFGGDDDDEKREEYGSGALSLRTENFLIPTGSETSPYIRIPIEQGPLARTIYGVALELMSDISGMDELSVDLYSMAQNIIRDTLPDGSIAQGLRDASNNTTYYGRQIVSDYAGKRSAPNQYNSDTLDVFKGASSALYSLGIEVSPAVMQYAAEQYSGVLGKFIIPALSGNKYTGERSVSQSLQNLWESAKKNFVADPVTYSDTMTNYNAAKEAATAIRYDYQNGDTVYGVSSLLDEYEIEEAVEEATKLNQKGGAFYDADNEISDLWDEISEIQQATVLTDSEKAAQIRTIRKEMNDIMTDALEEWSIYKMYYIDHDELAIEATERIKKGMN